MLASLLVAAAAASTPAPIVDKVDPPYWWTGMRNDTLQIMVSGAGVGDAKVRPPILE